MYADLLATGNMRTEGAALSARTVRYVHTILRKALSDATRKGLLVRNPSDAATPPSVRAAKAPEMAFWTPFQLARFLQLHETDELYPMVRLVAMSGLRRGGPCSEPTGLSRQSSAFSWAPAGPIPVSYSHARTGPHLTPRRCLAGRQEGAALRRSEAPLP